MRTNESWKIILIGCLLIVYGFVTFVLPISLAIISLMYSGIPEAPLGAPLPIEISKILKFSYNTAALAQRIFVPICSFICGIALLMKKRWARKLGIFAFTLNFIARLVTLLLLLKSPNLLQTYKLMDGNIWYYCLWFAFDVGVIAYLNLPVIKKQFN